MELFSVTFTEVLRLLSEDTPFSAKCQKFMVLILYTYVILCQNPFHFIEVGSTQKYSIIFGLK